MQVKKNVWVPLISVFMMINLVALLMGIIFKTWNVDPWLVAIANCMFFFISIYNGGQHIKTMKENNPHAMVRGVMGSTVLKLFVLGTAAFLYLFFAGEKRNVNGLFFSMGLYIIYTWLDVRIALKRNSN